jgi:3-isopropylmalate dehydratase small subunit
MAQGHIWKFGDNVDTDQIISSQYLLLPTIDEMKSYTFESLDPEFAQRFQVDDIVVGGANFGCGSSREQAPLVLKALGASAVIAKSFARIFFRNSINKKPLNLSNIICWFYVLC